MKNLIIYDHPYDQSFNHSIFEILVKKFEKNNLKYEIIDLHKDGFDPKFSSNDLKTFSLGKSSDLLVQKYQKLLKECDNVYFIFPIWWMSLPATTKGFCDKVFLEGTAYTYSKLGFLNGLLTNIKKATIISTSGGPSFYIKSISSGSIRSFKKFTLKYVGIKKVKWINIGNIKKMNEKRALKIFNKINKLK